MIFNVLIILKIILKIDKLFLIIYKIDFILHKHELSCINVLYLNLMISLIIYFYILSRVLIKIKKY